MSVLLMKSKTHVPYYHTLHRIMQRQVPDLEETLAL